MIIIKTWQARKERKMTLEDLAKLTGISKTTLNDIENSKTCPTLNQLETISKALGVRMSDLYDSKYK